MFNYIRYIILTLLFFALFFKSEITIPMEIIQSSIEKKLPIHISKKGIDFSVNKFDVLEVFEDSIKVNIIGEAKLSTENSLRKYIKKEGSFFSRFLKEEKIEKFVERIYDIDIISTVKPIINGSTLSIDIVNIDINGVLKFERLKGIIKQQIRKIKIPIKQLEKYPFVGEVTNVSFSKSGDLNVEVKFSTSLILILMFLFSLREIGLFMIEMYQRFISPHKGYNCAKGHLYGNGTCSSDTKKAFKEGGFISGVKEYRKSTKECRQAYERIKGTGIKPEACDLVMYAGCDGSPLAFGSETSLSGCEIGGCADVGSCDIGAC